MLLTSSLNLWEAFFYLALFNEYDVDFLTLLIGTEKIDSLGGTGLGRPRMRSRAEEAPRHARGFAERLERKSTT